MRSILNHEWKLVESLLPEDVPVQRLVPEQVLGFLSGPDAALRFPVILNESFTIYFDDDKDKRLKLEDTALGMPGTIGNEIVLVKDEATNKLTFLEFMGPSLPAEEVLAVSTQALANRLRNVLASDESLSLVADFEAVFGHLGGTHVSKLRSLAYSRLLVVDSTAYFFLGTSKDFMLAPWDLVRKYSLPGGEFQHICCGNGVALDGWFELSI